MKTGNELCEMSMGMGVGWGIVSGLCLRVCLHGQVRAYVFCSGMLTHIRWWQVLRVTVLVARRL